MLAEVSNLCILWNKIMFEPIVRHYFSSNNVRLLAYVFTGGDPQSEWLKRDESNRVYSFETRFLS